MLPNASSSNNLEQLVLKGFKTVFQSASEQAIFIQKIEKFSTAPPQIPPKL